MIYLLSNVKEFDWDQGNIDKNEAKHYVKWYECEQVFFNKPFLLLEDPKHSKEEKRYFGFGKTDLGRLLTVAFTVRNDKIRVVSARPMSRKERRRYGSEEKK